MCGCVHQSAICKMLLSTGDGDLGRRLANPLFIRVVLSRLSLEGTTRGHVLAYQSVGVASTMWPLLSVCVAVCAATQEAMFGVLVDVLTSRTPSCHVVMKSLVAKLCIMFPIAQEALCFLLLSERGLQGLQFGGACHPCAG